MRRPLRVAETAHPILYALDVRAWLDRLSREHGRRVRLGDVPDEAVAAITGTGCDLVWLIGVRRTGPRSRSVARARPEIEHEARAVLADFSPVDVAGSQVAIAERGRAQAGRRRGPGAAPRSACPGGRWAGPRFRAQPHRARSRLAAGAS